MLVKVYSSSTIGIVATKIIIETEITNGIKFFLVGLPDNAVKESYHRIDAALRNNGLKIPGKKITVNMAPADIKKEGSSFDLPIALSILAADEKLPNTQLLEKYMIIGELALDGSLRPIKGALPIALNALEEGFEGIILPEENAKQAAVVNNLKVFGLKNLREVLNFFENPDRFSPCLFDIEKEFYSKVNQSPYDFSDIKGQYEVKRAMEVAAAGGHNILMIGPPGAGKTMIARRLPSILPPLSLNETLETTKIHSVAGILNSDTPLLVERPFRNPHHTISDVALVGGGNYPQPGEISLAHNGVLFLDELPEFKRSVLEVLRQPIEDRVINISRAKFTVQFPASFMLVAAMNPCPCGFYNHPEKECTCSTAAIRNYLNRISGPLLDRFDIQIEVVPVPFKELSSTNPSETSTSIRQRVVNARKIQLKRFENFKGIFTNAQMNSKLIKQFCQIDEKSSNLLKTAVERLGLSARAYDRILKVARTIADLEEAENIQTHHIAEAIQYRSLDKESWGNK